MIELIQQYYVKQKILEQVYPAVLHSNSDKVLINVKYLTHRAKGDIENPQVLLQSHILLISCIEC